MKKLLLCLFLILAAWLAYLSYRFFTLPVYEPVNEFNSYDVSGFSTDLSKVIKNEMSSCVCIKSESGVSSGFIYHSDGEKIYVLCSYHGVSNGGDISVILHNGQSLPATLKDFDIFADLAMLVCDSDLEVKCVKFGDNELLNAGEFVVSIGTCGKLEYDFSSQFGMVSSKYREVENNIEYNEESFSYVLGLIQLSGEFRAGYSGAPVFNMNGEAVGIITMRDDDVVFALSSNEADLLGKRMLDGNDHQRLNLGSRGYFLKDLENYERANLSINFELTDGYYVDFVQMSSTGNELGLNRGDIILQINNHKIVDQLSLLEAIYDNSENCQILIYRDGEQLLLESVNE